MQHLERMAVDDSHDRRLLAREVPVERADADARHGGDFIGTRPVVALLHQNEQLLRDVYRRSDMIGPEKLIFLDLLAISRP